MNAPQRPLQEFGEVRLTAYRPFIDGLRAISILAVVLYHVGVPGITGGFVGVDIFFVISGFLIITQIVEALAARRFSFGDFWARRALRILPPYLLVLAFSIAVAPFVFVMPDEFKEFGKEVGHAGVMIVNHLFLIQQGYFDRAADTKVLLHLWSLAVEEQFYLAAPLILAGLWFIRRFTRALLWSRLVFWIAVSAFAASLAGCIYFTGIDGGRNYAFYLTPLRAWEFIAGGAIGYFLPAVRRLPAASIELLAAAGLAAIAIGVFLYSAETPYPSFRAALPVFGAVAIISSGIANPRIGVARVLAMPPMVWIGLVSYAWYLWHWPLLALARIAQFGERSIWTDLTLGIVSLGLAAATHYWLERPIRAWRQSRTARLGWTPVISGVVVCSVVATAGLLSFDWAWKRIETSVPAQYQPKYSPTVAFCDLQTMRSAEECLSLAGGRPLGLLVGDSHAVRGRNSLAEFAGEHGSVILSMASPGCIAFIGATVQNPDMAMERDCKAMQKNAMPLLTGGDVTPAYAILFSRWPLYGSGKPQYALLQGEGDEPAPDQNGFFIGELRKTIVVLQSLGIERVMVIGSTPTFARPTPSCLYLADRKGMDRAAACGVDPAVAKAYVSLAAARIAAAIDGLANVRSIDPLADFCDAGDCIPYDGDTLLFIDTNHLSDPGMARIIEGHPADFAWLVGGGGK